MPWKVVANGPEGKKHCVYKHDAEGNPIGESLGCHATVEEANAQLAALYVNVKERATVAVAFEPFAEVDLTKPIKLLPIGKWYRGKRILDLTHDRLQEMVQNFKNKLPRYRVGITLDHKEDSGKVGDIKDVVLMDDGLYATNYELSERGKKAVEQDGYDGVSAEVVWSLNGGASYQDPETGKEYDNVLVGAALTPRPFFGHGQVALYSADQGDEMESFEVKKTEGNESHPASHYLVVEDSEKPSTWHLRYKNEAGELDRGHMGGAWAALHGGYRGQKYEGPEKAAAITRLIAAYKQLGAEPPGEQAADAGKESEHMADEVVTEKVVEAPAPVDETHALAPAEELASKETVEKLSADLKAEKERADKFEAEIKAERLARRKVDLKGELEAFEALGLKTEEYVEHFISLEEREPVEAKWLMEQLSALDKAMKEAGLLREVGSAREGDLSKADQFVAMVQAKVKEVFKGDMTHWTEAMDIVSREHPALSAAYAGFEQ